MRWEVGIIVDIWESSLTLRFSLRAFPSEHKWWPRSERDFEWHFMVLNSLTSRQQRQQSFKRHFWETMKRGKTPRKRSKRILENRQSLVRMRRDFQRMTCCALPQSFSSARLPRHLRDFGRAFLINFPSLPREKGTRMIIANTIWHKRNMSRWLSSLRKNELDMLLPDCLSICANWALQRLSRYLGDESLYQWYDTDNKEYLPSLVFIWWSSADVEVEGKWFHHWRGDYFQLTYKWTNFRTWRGKEMQCPPPSRHVVNHKINRNGNNKPP